MMQVNADAHEGISVVATKSVPELEAVIKSHGAHHTHLSRSQERNLLFATV
ncbi:hypothetical protein KCP78_20435 [Salmonella enterica subsp. enterica]|nr:hypothetical protein KCP78_20435 [Salmonella enterica subsp. enterica]